MTKLSIFKSFLGKKFSLRKEIGITHFWYKFWEN